MGDMADDIYFGWDEHDQRNYLNEDKNKKNINKTKMENLNQKFIGTLEWIEEKETQKGGAYYALTCVNKSGNKVFFSDWRKNPDYPDAGVYITIIYKQSGKYQNVVDLQEISNAEYQAETGVKAGANKKEDYTPNEQKNPVRSDSKPITKDFNNILSEAQNVFTSADELVVNPIIQASDMTGSILSLAYKNFQDVVGRMPSPDESAIINTQQISIKDFYNAILVHNRSIQRDKSLAEGKEKEIICLKARVQEDAEKIALLESKAKDYVGNLKTEVIENKDKPKK